MRNYRAHGKQVVRNGEHVADAADETWAQIIADALNGEREHTGGPITLPDGPGYVIGHASPEYVIPKPFNSLANPPIAIEPKHKPFHHVNRRIGGYECTCGRRWDFDDGSDTCPGATS